MMQKLFVTLIVIVILLIVGKAVYENSPMKSAIVYYEQVSRERVRADVDLQPTAQKDAHYVGSKACAECHQEIFHVQHNSMHPKMIQDVKADPSVIIADFPRCPKKHPLSATRSSTLLVVNLNSGL